MLYKCEVCGKESEHRIEIEDCETVHKKERACELGRVYTLTVDSLDGKTQLSFPVYVYEKTEDTISVCGMSEYGLAYFKLDDLYATFIDADANQAKLEYSISGQFSMTTDAYIEHLKMARALCENHKKDFEDSIEQIDFLIKLVTKMEKPKC